jgi:micrococcal nuclease
MKQIFIIFLLFYSVIFSYGKTLNGNVKDVLSGDFIMVSTPSADFHVRLNHIDAPDDGQSFFQSSKRYLSKLIFKKNIVIKIEGNDIHRTPLVTIYHRNKNINKLMVSKGYAWWYYFYNTDMTYLNLEESAKRKRKGLWHKENPIEPFIYRETLRKNKVIIR